MNSQFIHSAVDLVEVTYQPELKAVYLKWFNEYDEGTRVRDAVLAALSYVRANGTKHWVADVSTSPHALSEMDYAWVSGREFSSAIQDSPLTKFVLIPPLPESGQDDSWVSEWEAGTLKKFGSGVRAKVCKSMKEARLFLVE